MPAAYTDKFLRAFKFSVLEWEAVYQKGHDGDPDFVVTERDPRDPGGATRFGIDQRDHPSVDVPSITLAQAQAIFHDGAQNLRGEIEGGEWTRVRGDDLSDKWSLALFDCAINPGLACKHWVQEILGLGSDGIFGPITIAAINSADDDALRTFLKRRDTYYKTRGAWADSFVKGWLARNTALKRELALT